MRIVAGTHRGRRLAAPRGAATRPTADRVREAVFSIIGPVDGLDVLDLFAGSGALGLEALSRGAATATMVERDPRAVAVIRANAEALGLEDRVRVVAADWRAALRGQAAARRRFGLCLLDPPYARAERVLAALGTALAPVMTGPGIVVVERPAALPPPHPEGMEIANRTDRTYGDTGVSVLRLAS
ncbi:MAG: 16S rRNA (guanine(966)-N(2))-methyltransferase RsmD [Thermoleophilia bacterium]